jgi:hypothetical protein
MSEESKELVLSNPTIKQNGSNNKQITSIYIPEARGASFRNPGITKADVKNAQQNKILGIISNQLSK